jgi:hypothetical protein
VPLISVDNRPFGGLGWGLKIFQGRREGVTAEPGLGRANVGESRKHARNSLEFNGFYTPGELARRLLKGR